MRVPVRKHNMRCRVEERREEHHAPRHWREERAAPRKYHRGMCVLKHGVCVCIYVAWSHSGSVCVEGQVLKCEISRASAKWVQRLLIGENFAGIKWRKMWLSADGNFTIKSIVRNLKIVRYRSEKEIFSYTDEPLIILIIHFNIWFIWTRLPSPDQVMYNSIWIILIRKSIVL